MEEAKMPGWKNLEVPSIFMWTHVVLSAMIRWWQKEDANMVTEKENAHVVIEDTHMVTEKEDAHVFYGIFICCLAATDIDVVCL